jgi:hypothetical protein
LTLPEASSVIRPALSALFIATASRSMSGHIVEQADVGAFRERFAQLVQRIDLDLDLDQMAGKGLARSHRLADSAGNGDVVVLDQDRVVEPVAVVGAAAAAHGVFLEGAQARNGLAGAGDFCPGVGNLCRQSARCGWRCPTDA